MASHRMMSTLRDKAGPKWHAVVIVGMEASEGSKVVW